jgi:hypothetical protein
MCTFMWLVSNKALWFVCNGCSADNECSKGESDVPDKGCSRKRYACQWFVRKQPKVISTEQASSDDACSNDFVGKSAVKFWNRK